MNQSHGLRLVLYSVVFLVTFTVILVGFQHAPVYLSVGDSMEPTFDHCEMQITDPEVTEEKLTEGDIIIFTSPDEQSVIHRIESIEQPYSKDSYYQVRDGFFVNRQEGTEYVDYQYHSPMDSSEHLYGETVYITRGDNNDRVDPYMIEQSDIVGIHYESLNLPPELCEYKIDMPELY